MIIRASGTGYTKGSQQNQPHCQILTSVTWQRGLLFQKRICKSGGSCSKKGTRGAPSPKMDALFLWGPARFRLGPGPGNGKLAWPSWQRKASGPPPPLPAEMLSGEHCGWIWPSRALPCPLHRAQQLPRSHWRTCSCPPPAALCDRREQVSELSRLSSTTSCQGLGASKLRVCAHPTVPVAHALHAAFALLFMFPPLSSPVDVSSPHD